MSRVGKQQLNIPSGVEVNIKDGEITVKGPKGEVKEKIHPSVTIEKIDNQIKINVANPEDKKERSLWGLYGSLVKSMLLGVTQGFEKKLEINGVGFKAAIEGQNLVLNVGYSHQVKFAIPKAIKIEVAKNVITVNGASKQEVGQVAAEIRKVKRPEPYKGKGIKYSDEIIKRKAGKTAKTAAA